MQILCYFRQVSDKKYDAKMDWTECILLEAGYLLQPLYMLAGNISRLDIRYLSGYSRLR